MSRYHPLCWPDADCFALGRSCTFCRKRKARCNRGTPCSTCIRCKNKCCVYGSGILQPETPLGQAKLPELRPAPKVLAPNDQSEQSPQIPNSPTAAAVRLIADRQGSVSIGQKYVVRHIVYKSRVYGRSHWMNGLLAAGHGSLFRIKTAKLTFEKVARQFRNH